MMKRVVSLFTENLLHSMQPIPTPSAFSNGSRKRATSDPDNDMDNIIAEKKKKQFFFKIVPP